MRTTKIVATLGPSTHSKEVIRKLLMAGADVFRLNASHGTQQEHAERIQLAREAAAELGVEVGLLLDLQGPKIRLGTFEHGKVVLETGAKFMITTAKDVVGNEQAASTTYAGFANDVKKGNRVLLNDGAVELRVLETDGTAVRCEVLSGGVIGDRKGINLPGVAVSASSLTKKDMADVVFGLEQNVDFLALSFVRKPADVLRLKLFLEEKERVVPIISKIEKPEAWENLEGILQESDGVMVARGDLGVEVALERVPFIQKSIIERAREHGKAVITATQMLESMIENPYPTRAEVSDVANAIYDGTDAVMLSAETSAGKFPVEAVKMMSRIAVEAEASARHGQYYEITRQEGTQPSIPEMIAEAAHLMAQTANVAAIICFTASGASARMISRYRPPVPIIAFTHTVEVARQLTVQYGVRTVIVPPLQSTDEMLLQMDRVLRDRQWVKEGDAVIMVAGQPIGVRGTTNLIKLYRIGDSAPE